MVLNLQLKLKMIKMKNLKVKYLRRASDTQLVVKNKGIFDSELRLICASEMLFIIYDFSGLCNSNKRFLFHID